MSASPMTGRKNRSVTRAAGMDLREDVTRRMREKRAWSSGCSSSRSARCASHCRLSM